MRKKKNQQKKNQLLHRSCPIGCKRLVTSHMFRQVPQGNRSQTRRRWEIPLLLLLLVHKTLNPIWKDHRKRNTKKKATTGGNHTTAFSRVIFKITLLTPILLCVKKNWGQFNSEIEAINNHLFERFLDFLLQFDQSDGTRHIRTGDGRIQRIVGQHRMSVTHFFFSFSPKQFQFNSIQFNKKPNTREQLTSHGIGFRLHWSNGIHFNTTGDSTGNYFFFFVCF